MKTYRVFGVKRWTATVEAESEEEAKKVALEAEDKWQYTIAEVEELEEEEWDTHILHNTEGGVD